MFGATWDEQHQEHVAEKKRVAKKQRKKEGLELGSQGDRSGTESAITRRSSGATSNSRGSAVSRLTKAFQGTRLSDKSDDKLRSSSYNGPSARWSSPFSENTYVTSGNPYQRVSDDVNQTDEHDERSKNKVTEDQRDEVTKENAMVEQATNQPTDQPTNSAGGKIVQENTAALEALEGLKTPPPKTPTFVLLTTPSTPEDAGSPAPKDDPTNPTLIQWLGEDSYITRTTTVTYKPRGDADVNDQVIETNISADPSPFSTSKGSKSRAPPPIVRPSSPAAGEEAPSFSVLVDNWFTALHGPSKALSPSLPSATNGNPSGAAHVDGSAQAQASPHEFLSVPKAPAIPPKSSKRRVTDADAWKPPNDWGCESSSEMVPKSNEKQDTQKPKNKNVARIQNDVEAVEISSPKRVLSRLVEEGDEPSDTPAHMQKEKDRKCLMLSVLHDMGRSSSTVVDTASQSRKKLLALFESEGKPR